MIDIIPAIDLIGGKCVRLSQGDYSTKKIYNENPVEVAKQFEDHGIKRLHLVDLDGARDKHVVNHDVLNEIAVNTSLIIDYGGGIKTNKDMEIVMDNGANMATIGSVAITEPYLFKDWLDKYSRQRIILGADVKDKKIAIGGWKTVTQQDLFSFIEKYLAMGIKYVLCTDISKDGMLSGTAIELYKELKKEFPHLYFIASGGISEIDEIEELEKAGIDGAIIGKAIYEGKIHLKDLTKYIQ